MKKVSDFAWEVPAEETGGVPVRIYANEKIMESMGKDRTIKQASNAARLPTMEKHMLVMPDGHEGYGFPVGGVAAFDAENGIISPGLVGFDINCLKPDSKILSEDNLCVQIKEMDKFFPTKSFDTQKGSEIETVPLLAMKKVHMGNIVTIKTACGKELVATSDHPIMTKAGMVPIGDLQEGAEVLVRGHEGIEYVAPKPIRLIDEAVLSSTMECMGITDRGNAKNQILSILSELGLSKIDTSSEKMPKILKLMGIIFGDGTIPRNGQASIYGKLEDLEDIKKDIEKLGFNCGIFKRLRHSSIDTIYGTRKFENMEYCLRPSSRSFSVLFASLGVPVGNKAIQGYGVPGWIMESELWCKKLFLSAYFGAEMTKPMAPNGYNFTGPSFSVNKLARLSGSAIGFLNDIKSMLSTLSISCSDPKFVEGYSYEGKNGMTLGFRMVVLSETSNLIRFFGTVGYSYNRQKAALSSLAVLYLNWLTHIRSVRASARKTALALYSGGLSVSEVVEHSQNEYAGKSFIKHAIWTERKGARAWNVTKFKEFCDNALNDGYAFDRIIKIEKQPYNGDVYDLTINDINHNFVANGVVVSNCGVRLIKTNLTAKEIKPKMKQLMDSLFKNVPSGVGSRINLGFTKGDLDKVGEEGVKYIIDKGFGFADDLERIEEHGVLKGADLSKVSDFARKRGVNELGTLGAGNHFLEVQRVDKILSKELAKGFGLEKDQVTIMIHSGSRGFGHQICSDYLRIFAEYQAKENIVPPDPELCYAFIGSKPADDYLAAMKAAVNFAFTNRQVMTNSIRKSFKEVFDKSPDALGMELLYDVAHNIAKPEDHEVDGKKKRLLVHRKGATRAFAPHHPQVPDLYKPYGQPVIIPGSMGSASYVLAGRAEAMKETFGSSCHGSGRVMSRHQAIRDIPASRTLDDLSGKGIELRVRNKKLISEEAEWAYKNVDDVVQSIEGAKISNIVARLVPLGVAKG